MTGEVQRDRPRATPVLDLRRARSRGDVQSLLAALTHEDQRVRDIAVRSLGLVGDRAAVPDLLDRLSDSDDGHRVLVIKALERIGDERAARPLLVLADDRNTPGVVRLPAMAALAELGDPRGAAMLAETLLDPGYVYPRSRPLPRGWERATRKYAARRLIGIGSTEVVPQLQSALDGLPFRERRVVARVVRSLSNRSE